MTELIYKIGETYTTNYAIALSLWKQTKYPIQRVYRPVDETTDEQREQQRIHREKAAAYRAKQKTNS
jgi:hypothetical protein